MTILPKFISNYIRGFKQKLHYLRPMPVWRTAFDAHNLKILFILVFALLIAPFFTQIVDYFLYQMDLRFFILEPVIASFVNLVITAAIILVIMRRIVLGPLYQLTRELEEKNMEIAGMYGKLSADLNKAAKIHQKILPAKEKETEKIAIATHFQPADFLGGDFLNYFVTEQKMIFYLSDVTGHGVDGTMMNTFVKEMLDSYIRSRDDETISPGRLLSYLDREYRKIGFPEDYFVSCFLGVIDLNHYQFKYAGAGFQETILLGHEKNSYTQLTVKGLPISCAIPQESMEFQTQAIPIAPGTTLLANTDGLTEQVGEGTGFYEKKEHIFYRNAHRSPREIIQTINQAFREFNNGSIKGDDDITVMVVKIK